MSEAVRKVDNKPAEGFTHTVPKIVSMMEQESMQLAENVVSVTAEGYQIVKVGPCRFIGKSIYARAFGYSHEIFSNFWETKTCKWVFEELDKLPEYAGDHKHDAAFMTWESYNGGEREGNGGTTHGPNQFMGYTVGRFMKAGTPVPENMDYIDIPENYFMAQLFFEIPEAEYKRGVNCDLEEGVLREKYEGEFPLRDAIEAQGLYGYNRTFMGTFHPDKDQNNGKNYGYFVGCVPLTEEEKQIREQRLEEERQLKERILSGEAFPYDLQMPLVPGDFTYWNENAMLTNAAKEMVVEYEGTIGAYMFASLDPNPWVGYAIHDESETKVIREEPGKITFSLTETEGEKLGFALWDKDDAAKVKRVYLQV